MRTGELSTTTYRKRKTLKQTVAGSWKGWLILLPCILLFYFMVWRPIAQGMYLSFFDLEGYDPQGFVGFRNYKDVLTDTLFIKTLKNTFAYVLWSIVISFLPPIVIAIVLNEIVHAKSGIYRL